MSSRLSLNTKRPVSAIFIGTPHLPSSYSGSHLPDLPDPPISPSSSSGLPSPPATNSTGSGSAGGGDTQAPAPKLPSLAMNRGSFLERNGSRSSVDSQQQADDENELDGDHTAKLPDEFGRLPSVKRTPPSENAAALQRVKSLTLRNRMVLDKLTSISRLSTPSPTRNFRGTNSPANFSTTSSANTSSRLSTSSSLRRKREEPQAVLSGSETERERSSSVSSSVDSFTPPTTAPLPSERPSSVSRQRRISAPESPRKALEQLIPNDDQSSQSSVCGMSLTPRKRQAAMGSEPNGDVASAALAAVANSRRSPTGRRRHPLPREFFEQQSSENNRNNGEPSVPYRERIASSSGSNPSPSLRPPAITDSPTSPRRIRFREFGRKPTRWQSQDFSSSSLVSLDTSPGAEGSRRQNRRGGSNESVLAALGLSGGRSVVGETLRAAGLVSGELSPNSPRRPRTSGGESSSNVSQQMPRREGPREASRTHNRAVTMDDMAHAALQAEVEPRTPANQRLNGYIPSSRPATSMAGYRDLEYEPQSQTAPLLRTHRSAYPMGERERITVGGRPQSALQTRAQTHTPSQVSTALPSGALVRRSTLGTPGNSQEHTKLLSEALSMFESNLARLPSMGTTTTRTVPEVFRAAQQIVHSTNALNTMLRTGTSRALEEQIEAEVCGAGDDNVEAADAVEIWGSVGADFRESLKVSDELVRSMTGFFLEVGRLLKESAAASPAQQQHHSRGSIDAEYQHNEQQQQQYNSPDVAVNGRLSSLGSYSNSSGHRSGSEGRRSWEPTSRERDELLKRTDNFSRPPSSLNVVHNNNPYHSPIGSDQLQPRPELPRNYTVTSAVSATSSSSARSRDMLSRRLFTPRESQEDLVTKKPLTMTPSNSEETVQGHEPSPTPSTRQQSSLQNLNEQRRRALVPITVPAAPPAPALATPETMSRNNSTSSTDTPSTLSSTSSLARSSSFTAPTISSASRSIRRAKVSSTSNATIRANSIFPSFSTTGNATTAVTNASVSASPERRTKPLSLFGNASRTNLSNSISRLSGAALAGLQQQFDKDGRKRTISDMSTDTEEAPILTTAKTIQSPSIPITTPASVMPPVFSAESLRSPMSGSETERPPPHMRPILGNRSRASLDHNPTSIWLNSNPRVTERRERRKTVTDLFRR